MNPGVYGGVGGGEELDPKTTLCVLVAVCLFLLAGLLCGVLVDDAPPPVACRNYSLTSSGPCATVHP